MDTTKQYKKDDLTVFWDQKKCIHAGICVKTLPQVYNPSEKPWIKLGDVQTAFLTSQIDACPSGALTYKYTTDEQEQNRSV
ncbi:putative Fe-S cluster protein YjdI [Flavobacterium sp. 7E]|uniref:(4Fe-4S)-binding protein n=1 Tax=Flavobacterium sp. 7E TaxID=2735898 RepID=UPI0015703BD5|nr:(4Fe-4S)-binding protein [Flavobacterium sp. 7E]NRS87821.1 putative Fe-S cluster protein YjdI [Flavobacterium sp. 7E]